MNNAPGGDEKLANNNFARSHMPCSSLPRHTNSPKVAFTNPQSLVPSLATLLRRYPGAAGEILRGIAKHSSDELVVFMWVDEGEIGINVPEIFPHILMTLIHVFLEGFDTLEGW